MSPELWTLLFDATLDTFYMVAIAAGFGVLFGLPLGVFLATSQAGDLFAAQPKVLMILL